MADFFTFQNLHPKIFTPPYQNFVKIITKLRYFHLYFLRIFPTLPLCYPYFINLLPLCYSPFTLNWPFIKFVLNHTEIILLPLLFSYFTLSLPLSHPSEFLRVPLYYPHFTLILPFVNSNFTFPVVLPIDYIAYIVYR